ncbi:MAG: type II toxin-antitoxin system VapC family toxin [Desulfobacterales bacterium]|jgi:predicted nucleic acid-binding protein
MPVKVVDASAIGALVFAEPDAEDVMNELSDGMLIAPSLIHYELASICLKKIRNHPSKTNELITAFQMVGRLAIDTVAVKHVEVIDLAKRSQLTTYDASYLWLTQKAGASLVTLDKRLKRAVAE